MINHNGRLTYKIAEYAHMFGLHEATVRRRIKAGDLHAVLVGRSYRIPATEVDRVMRNRVATESAA